MEKTEKIGLDPDLLSEAFPFHLAIGPDLRCLQFGRSLKRVVPEVQVGSDIRDLFHIKRPHLNFDYESLRRAKELLVILEVQTNGRLLRGQFLLPPSQDVVLFVGSPWLTEVDSIKKLGMTLGSFAIHDPAVDLLQLLQSQTQALQEAKQLATKLAGQKKEIIQAKELAEEANEAKSRFLAIVSHEIRTPLNGVIGFTGLLLEKDLDEQSREFAATIQGSAEALLALINEILDFSKMEFQKLELEEHSFCLNACVEQALGLVSAPASRKGLELYHHVDSRLPVFLMGDASRIRQVMMNLLGNAVKFTKEGGVNMEVTGEPVEGDPNLWDLNFEISDTGIGISKSAHQLIFKPFTQADASTTRHFGGTGLGLAICHTLVELMGGRISVDSEPGQGSRFKFGLRLPIPDRPSQESPPAWVEARFRDLGVVVVDDHPGALKSLLRRLREWDVDAEGFTSLAAAEAFLETNGSNLVIVDHSLLQDDSVADFGLRSQLGLEEGPRLFGMGPHGADVRFRSLFGLRQSGWLNKPIHAGALYQTLTRKPSGNGESSVMVLSKEETSFLRARRVLVAEDNQTNQKLAKLTLKKLKLDCDVVADGNEAVDALKRRRYDLVLMDVQMPNKDGLEATREFRELEQTRRYDHRTPIIALTANAFPEAEELCLEAGMDAIVIKPIRLKDLKDTIERYIL